MRKVNWQSTTRHFIWPGIGPKREDFQSDAKRSISSKAASGLKFSTHTRAQILSQSSIISRLFGMGALGVSTVGCRPRGLGFNSCSLQTAVEEFVFSDNAHRKKWFIKNFLSYCCYRLQWALSWDRKYYTVINLWTWTSAPVVAQIKRFAWSKINIEGSIPASVVSRKFNVRALLLEILIPKFPH